jgi:small-conductance mechanosensitive channel
VPQASPSPALEAALILVAAAATGLLVDLVLRFVLSRLARRTASPLDEALLRYTHAPGLLLFPAVFLLAAGPAARLPERAERIVQQAASLAVIAAVAWMLVSGSRIIEDALRRRFRENAGTILARRLLTQVRVLRGAAAVLVWLIAGAVMLMTFPRVRELGASLLASAGLAGLIVGLAARPVLENLIAGVQLAMTQPIRIEDAVVIEGQFGYIEEIRLTYVVVRLWDERRIVAPLTYFIQKTFENWSYRSPEVIAAATVVVRANVPIDVIREELRRILEGTALWTGRQWTLQVTSISDMTMELRAAMGAVDATRAWDLRCLVREGLIRFLQERYMLPPPLPPYPNPPPPAPVPGPAAGAAAAGPAGQQPGADNRQGPRS